MSLHDDVFVTYTVFTFDYVTNTKGKYSVCNKHIIMQWHTFLLYRWDYVTNTKGKYSVCNKHIIMQGHTFLSYTVFTFGIGNIVSTI
jgi:hypothetical protein